MSPWNTLQQRQLPQPSTSYTKQKHIVVHKVAFGREERALSLLQMRFPKTQALNMIQKNLKKMYY